KGAAVGLGDAAADAAKRRTMQGTPVLGHLAVGGIGFGGAPALNAPAAQAWSQIEAINPAHIGDYITAAGHANVLCGNGVAAASLLHLLSDMHIGACSATELEVLFAAKRAGGGGGQANLRRFLPDQFSKIKPSVFAELSAQC